jgi:hypothetical protein
MFVDVTSKRQVQRKQRSNWIKAKHKLAQDLPCNWRLRLKVPIQEAICLSGNMQTGHTAHARTINRLYLIRNIVGGILQSRENEHAFILSVFIFVFLDAYYIVFYATSLPFLFIQFFAPPPPPPNFATLGDLLVCLAVEPAIVASGCTHHAVLTREPVNIGH